MKEKIHFVGIGGIGMSGLARYFKAAGYAVSGSDAMESDITRALRKDAINVKIGQKRANIARDMAFLIYNRAIPADNPELLAAGKLGVPAIPYAQVLGAITGEYDTIAITGSHGKSTTTALAGLALAKGGLDPTVLVGTNLKEFGGKNFRRGKSPWLVLEADDFGAAFLHYSPLISIVTNVDREHLDFYKTFAGVKRAFLAFMARTREGGTLILNRDDAPLWSLRKQIAAIAKQKDLTVVWYSTIKKLRSTMKIPGEHNLSNAAAVLALGRSLKIPKAKILTALGSYRGAWRRMEYRGEFSIFNFQFSISVYDDYAHHPTEIRATLKAFKEKFPRSPLICVFQPHQAKRLAALFREFISSFADADALILLPFYRVAGRDAADRRYTSETLAAAIRRRYPKKKIYYLANPRQLKMFIKNNLISGMDASLRPVIVMMGAGDIVKYTAGLVK
ncbi:MAG TPA: UDP-N-acetylmuramate--L-alanine ligase [Candidatus Paceibacterota bacterium]|nr:UDP-N-acetylmuramate--L-alanine ligase [Candidatus Paceibacterota bacterium]